MDEEYCEVELPGGVIVKARLGTGMPPNNLNKSGDRVPIEKQKGDTPMSTTDLQTKIDELIEKAQQDAEQMLARVEAKIQATPPAPLPSKLELSGLSFPELQAMTRAGKLSLNDFNTEMDLRRRNPKAHQQVVEMTERAHTQLTASHLAATVKSQYLAQKDREKATAIIKSAMDSSIEKMGQCDTDLGLANLSQAERRELAFQRDNEAQFQERLLGSPEAVAKYWLEYVARPAVDVQKEALATLQKTAADGDPVAATWLEMKTERENYKR